MAADSSTIRPIHDWLLVELDPDHRATESGLVLPDESSYPVTGTVRAASPGSSGLVTQHADGTYERRGCAFVRAAVRPGQRVLLDWGAGRTGTVDGQTVRWIREHDVLGIVEE